MNQPQICSGIEKTWDEAFPGMSDHRANHCNCNSLWDILG